MIATKYHKDIIDKAHQLFIKGWSYAKIAKELDIKRAMTVFDWAKKFNWSREASSESEASEAFKALQSAWIKLGKKAADFLIDKHENENITVTEAIKILKEVTNLVRYFSIDEKQDPLVPKENEAKVDSQKAKVLRVLEFNNEAD